MAKCKSCGAEIIWARTEDKKAIPLDGGTPLMVATLVEIDSSGCAIVKIQKARLTHFATCPHAAEHRKEKDTNGK